MKPIVIYDDSCKMCTNFVNYIKKKSDTVNGELEFLPISEIKNKSDIVNIDEQQLQKSVHLVVNGQKTLSQFQAIQEICRRVNIFHSLYQIKSPLLIFLLNSFYKFIAKHRENFLFQHLSQLLFKSHN